MRLVYCLCFLIFFLMNIFVARLDYGITDDDLRTAFEAYGEVESAKIIMDRETGRSRGFGFVEMPNDDEGKAAIEDLNGAELNGREIAVKESEPREKRGGGGYGVSGGAFGARVVAVTVAAVAVTVAAVAVAVITVVVAVATIVVVAMTETVVAAMIATAIVATIAIVVISITMTNTRPVVITSL